MFITPHRPGEHTCIIRFEYKSDISNKHMLEMTWKIEILQELDNTAAYEI